METGYKVSDKYVRVNSSDVINNLTSNGYEVTKMAWAKTRIQEKEGFQKHIIRVTKPDLDFKISGLTPELVIMNSYDGSQSFRVMLGIFRMICSNGLVAGSTFQEHRVRHIGDNVHDDVLVALDSASKQFGELQGLVEKYSNMSVSQDQMNYFLNRVAVAITPDNMVQSWTHKLGITRREEDRNGDLFTVLNVIQENALNGGMTYLTRNEEGTVKQNTTRRIKSLDRQVAVNKLIFDVAAEIAA